MKVQAVTLVQELFLKRLECRSGRQAGKLVEGLYYKSASNESIDLVDREINSNYFHLVPDWKLLHDMLQCLL